MNRFVALPVGAGDSFYLERNGRSVLVDGGRSEAGFANIFRHHVNRTGVDVLVCTHNDADHANGIIGFLAAGLRCREVWLPGKWLGVLKDVLRPGEAVAEDILGGALEIWSGAWFEDQPVPGSLEDLGHALSPVEMNVEPSEDDAPSEWPEEIGEAMENGSDENDGALRLAEWKGWWAGFISPRGYPLHDRKAFYEIVSSAIDAADRIRRIARMAYDNGIPVRWFTHSPGRGSGGISGYLHVVGAQQVARVYPHRPLLARLALSTVNEESLVLYSPPDLQAPGVLFCADSDLRGMSLPLQARDLVTVPHHGAETNQSAYLVMRQALGAALPLTTWVRSDSRSRSRPGQTFVALPGRKFCTICRPGPLKQRVALYGRKGAWHPENGLRSCLC